MSMILEEDKTPLQGTEIVTRVRQALRKLSYNQLDGVDCLVANGQVTLSGILRSYYLKQIAQAIAMRVPGVQQVENRIQVIE